MVRKRKKSAKVTRNMRRKKKRGGNKRMTAKVMRNLALKRRASKAKEFLVVRPFHSRVTGRTSYMVSVVGGPQDLLARADKAQAIEDGKAYVARHYPHFAVRK